MLITGSPPASFTVYENVATMSGVIDVSTPEVVENLIQENPEIDTINMLLVPGSIDDEANLRAAKMIRAANLNTHIPSAGDIASGGVDFFLAGKIRTMDQGAMFGVHSWGSGNPFSSVSAIDLPRDHQDHQPYLEYYREMGITEDFYWFTLEAASPDNIHYMAPEEIERYGFING